ncbi:hypothetical protein ACFX15_000822 [Malus domestica]
MVSEKDVLGNVEWSINVADGTKNTSGLVDTATLLGLKGAVGGLVMKVWWFLVKAWKLGVAELRKVIHALKVGLAISVVLLFYYMRSLHEGATLYKSINRAAGTSLAGSLGLGVHWSSCKAGENFEPIFIGASVFLQDLSELLTYHRQFTVGIGTFFCVLISMHFYPNWAGQQLHCLIHSNLEKLADSLDGYVLEYFKEKEA